MIVHVCMQDPVHGSVARLLQNFSITELKELELHLQNVPETHTHTHTHTHPLHATHE